MLAIQPLGIRQSTGVKPYNPSFGVSLNQLREEIVENKGYLNGAKSERNYYKLIIPLILGLTVLVVGAVSIAGTLGWCHLSGKCS